MADNPYSHHEICPDCADSHDKCDHGPAGPCAVCAWQEGHDSRNEEVKALQEQQYIPGQWRCLMCGFQLSSNNLYVNSGTVGPNNSQPEPCPNDGQIMVRVTWEERCNEFSDRLSEEIPANRQLLDDLAAMRSAVQSLEQERDELKRQVSEGTAPRLRKQQPCGCIVCTCEDQVQCQGCGSKQCGTHKGQPIPNPVYEDHPLHHQLTEVRATIAALRRQGEAFEAEALIEELRGQLNAAWEMIANSYDIEPRKYFEEKYPDGPPLAVAVHYIWKRKALPPEAPTDLNDIVEAGNVFVGDMIWDAECPEVPVDSILDAVDGIGEGEIIELMQASRLHNLFCFWTAKADGWIEPHCFATEDEAENALAAWRKATGGVK